MGTYKEVYGDLIKLALQGEFQVIAHGCNCFCVMGAGIAVPMKENFDCDKFDLEWGKTKGDINKLGQIDYKVKIFSHNDKTYDLTVVNCYSQYHYGTNHVDGTDKPIDYEALTLCLRKINFNFPFREIGLPLIGGGLAGGDPERIKEIIKKELKDCNVTLVLHKKD